MWIVRSRSTTAAWIDGLGRWRWVFFPEPQGFTRKKLSGQFSTLLHLHMWCGQIWGKIGIDFFRVVKVTSILELMQRQAGSLVGPIQSHRLAMREHFSTSLGKTKTGYKDWNQWMETGRVQQFFHEVSLLAPILLRSPSSFVRRLNTKLQQRSVTRASHFCYNSRIV